MFFYSNSSYVFNDLFALNILSSLPSFMNRSYVPFESERFVCFICQNNSCVILGRSHHLALSLEQSQLSIRILIILLPSLLSWCVASHPTYKPAQLSPFLHLHTHPHTFPQLFYILKLPTCPSLWKKEESAWNHSGPYFPVIPSHIAAWILLPHLFYHPSQHSFLFFLRFFWKRGRVRVW